MKNRTLLWLVPIAVFAFFFAGDMVGAFDTMVTQWFYYDSALNIRFNIDTANKAVFMDSGSSLNWSSTTANVETPDVGISRPSAGFVKVTDGSSGVGAIQTGGLYGNVQKVTGTYAASATDYMLECDSTSSTFDLTLPDPKTNQGQIFFIKKINAGNNITLKVGGGGGNIDASSTATLSSQWGITRVISDGTNYFTM